MSSDKLEQNLGAEEVCIFPASFAQQRLWFIDQLLPNDSNYVIPIVFRLAGSLHRSHLQQSLQSIVHRHESLRTTFDIIDGELVQVIASAVPVFLEQTDLRTLPANNREAVAIEQIWHETQQPFDLKKGSLFRCRLVQLQDAEHLLLLMLHHIIFDEWSSGVLIRELGESYAARVEKRSAVLPELPIQYADFAHWQREWLQGEVLDRQLCYWKQQLLDVPVLDLSGVAALGGTDSKNQGASQWLELPQQLLDKLEKLSQQTGATLFMTLLAAFQTLLHRYTGQTDMAIGSPIANRQRSELEGLIGFLVNSLVLRTNLEGDLTFRELLLQVRQVTLAAYEHQDLPFEKLVEEIQPVRSLGQNPLFQVVFALQNTSMAQLTLPGLVLSPVELETKTSRFALELYLWKSGDNFRNLWGKDWQQSDGLRGIIVYNTGLFDPATIASLRQHFQTLLEGIVAHPDLPLSALPLLPLETQRSLLQNWHGNQSAYPALCIHRLFERQVQKQPTAIAVQFGEQSFTYQELNQGSNQLARYLQRLGIKSAMSVGICLERGVEAIAAILAVLKAGAVYVPLDPSYPVERLQFMVKDAEITVVLAQAAWADTVKTPQTTVVCLEQSWDAIAQELDENLFGDGMAEQLAYIIYTSGSTGTPKGVMVPHRAVNRLVCDTNYIQIESSDRMAQVANLAFDAATFEIWGALLNGAQLVGIEQETALSPTDFAIALQQQHISILFLTTALLNQTVSQVPNAFRSLKYLLFGGETVNVDCVRSIVKQGKPKHLLHLYGPTENTTFSTAYEVQDAPEYAATIPIGQAIRNTQVYLLDTHLNPVPANVSGEIYLGGDGLAQGYLNRPELTSERFINFNLNQNSLVEVNNQSITLYRTGDRARYRSDGNLEFLGRTDDQVKLRGFRIELGEIERAIAQHSTVRSVVVIVRESNASGSVLCDRQLIAYVVPEAPNILTERELRSFLKTKLPSYMLPAAFVMLDNLPLTANGKVDQKALPLPSATVNRESSQPQAPTTSLEASLVQVWAQLLGKTVGIYDNFFESGGHSLLATQLVSRIRDRFQVEFPLRAVFETPTIVALAEKINTLRETAQIDSSSLTHHQSVPAKRWEEIEL
jgi:amino acid adenylation domain-containing protein